MIRKIKKGFTLIELVVVIAVIAILAAVSVISYVAITRKAKESNDHMMLDQINTSLRGSSILQKKSTVHEIVENFLGEEGFDVRTIKPELKDARFVYSYNNGKFGYWMDEKVVYPSDLAKINSTDNNDLWFFETETDVNVTYSDGYSHYLVSADDTTTVTANGGIDVGKCTTISSITFARESQAKNPVVIRTNSASTTLTINAKDDTVNHYDAVGKVDAQKVDLDECYNEYGTSSYVKLTEGKVVAKNGGKIGVVFANNTDSSKVAVAKEGNGTIEKGLTTVEAVDLNNYTSYGVHLDYSADGSTPYTATEIENAGQAAIADAVTAENVEKAEPGQSPKSLAVFNNGVLEGYLTIEEFRNNVNAGTTYAGKVIKLGGDINLGNEQWTPIGIKWESTSVNYAAYPLLQEQGVTGATIFSGTFDGNNHTVSGLLIENAYYGALFGRVGNATIQNLTVKGRVYGQDSGGVVGRAGSGTVTLSHITSDVIVGIDSQSEIQGKGKAGGLVAYADCTQLNIEYCVNKGNISSHNANAYCAGLLAGSGACNVSITNSSNEGSITASGSDARVGGLVGRFAGHASNVKSLTITDSSNSGSITLQGGGSFSYAGGIIGSMNDEPSHLGTLNVQRVTNEGNVTGTPSGTPAYTPNVKNVVFVGGIFGTAGLNEGVFSKVTNTGAISGMVVGGIGGGLGQQKLNNAYAADAISFSECINEGSVTCTHKTGMDYVCAAGLIGNISNGYITINNTCTAKDATISATVSGDVNIVCRLVGNIINDGCKNLVVHISETFDGDTMNTFGKIGTTIFDNNGNPSSLKYYGTKIGSIINVNGLSTVTDMD